MDLEARRRYWMRYWRNLEVEAGTVLSVDYWRPWSTLLIGEPHRTDDIGQLRLTELQISRREG